MKTAKDNSALPESPSAGNNNSRWNLQINAGQTALIPQKGTFFEFLVATGRVAVRAGTTYFSGQYNEMEAGYGQDGLDFEKLEVENLESFPVVISIMVGTGQFINRQLVLATNSTPSIANPVYPVPLAATRVDIPDLSGQAFTDIDGNNWLAISRVSILIFNLDSGNSYKLLKYGSVNVNDPAIAQIPTSPLPIRLDIAGNYSVYIGGASVNMIVSEVYLSIPASVITS